MRNVISFLCSLAIALAIAAVIGNSFVMTAIVHPFCFLAAKGTFSWYDQRSRRRRELRDIDDREREANRALAAVDESLAIALGWEPPPPRHVPGALHFSGNFPEIAGALNVAPAGEVLPYNKAPAGVLAACYPADGNSISIAERRVGVLSGTHLQDRLRKIDAELAADDARQRHRRRQRGRRRRNG